jgi:hypothetical protein
MNDFLFEKKLLQMQTPVAGSQNPRCTDIEDTKYIITVQNLYVHAEVSLFENSSDQASSHGTASFADVETLASFGSYRAVGLANHFDIVSRHHHLGLILTRPAEVGSFVCIGPSENEHSKTNQVTYQPCG